MCFATSFDILAAASKRPVETARAKAKVWKEAEKVKQVGRTGAGGDFFRAGWDCYRAGWDFFRAGWDFYRTGWDFTVPVGIFYRAGWDFTVPAGSSPAEIGLAPLLLHTAGGCTWIARRSFRRTTNSRR